jgi:hypothetical protein
MYENIADKINESVLNQFHFNSMNTTISFISLLYIIIYIITFVVIRALKPTFLLNETDKKMNVYKLIGVSIIISLFITILIYFTYKKIYT